MRLAYFPGCKVNFGLAAYGRAVERVMAALGVTLVPLPFNCCGNPARGKNLAASVLAGIKNLTLAQARGLDILTPCQCCFGQLKHSRHWYLTQKGLREKVDLTLAEEGHRYQGEGLVQDPVSGKLENRQVRVRHLLDFLFHDYGTARLKSRITDPLPGWPVVLQQGCHALRPFTVTQFDNPFAPLIFRELAGITGLLPLDWDQETQCCGDPAAPTHRELALRICLARQESAARAKARYIATGCTHCQIQYERIRTAPVRALPFAVLLGMALGLDFPGTNPDLIQG